MSVQPTVTVLLVEDSHEDRATYRRYLSQDEGYSYQVLEADSVEQAFAMCDQHSPDLVLLDYWLPDATGLAFLQGWPQVRRGTPGAVVVLTGQGSETVAVAAMKQGAQDYLPKSSLTASQLLQTLHTLLDQPVHPPSPVPESRDRQQAEQALQQSRILLQLVMDSLPLAIFWKDRQSRFLGCNRQLVMDAGLSCVDEILGKTDFDLPWRDQAPLYQQDDQAVMASGQPKLNIEEPLTKPGQIQAWLRTNKLPLHSVTGEIIGVVASYEDITERKQIEQERDRLLQLLAQQNQTLEDQVAQRTAELRASEERFRTLVEASSDWIWEIDETGTFTYVSPQVYQLLGYTPEEVLGRNIFDLMPTVEAQRISDLFSDMIAAPAPFVCVENINQHRDGRLVVLESSGVPIFDAQGTCRGFRGIDRDITARKTADETLKQQLTAIESSIDGIAILNQERHYIYLNRAHIELYGYHDASELLGKSWEQLYAPSEMERFQQEIFPRLAQERVWRGEAIATRRDGTTFIEEVTLTLAENGTLICVCRDITERHEAELALQRSEEQFRTFFDHSPIAIALASATTYQVITANRAYHQLLGYSEAELIQMSFADLTHPEDVSKDIEQVERMSRGEIAGFQMEKRFIRKNGDELLTNMTVALIRDRDGYPLYSIGMMEDITERKQAEMQLQQVNERLTLTNAELYRATRLKDEFLANMSHELRTPLNAILGLSESLQDQTFGLLNDRQKATINTIERSGQHLLALINGILDLAKVESGKLELQFAPVSIADLCASSISFIRHQAIAKQIQLDVDVPANLPNLIADELRLRQVLINLLNNAVKFTPEGGSIQLMVQVDPVLEQPCLHISVMDTGIGIAQEDLTKLFQPFTQIDSRLNRKHSGTGLGLSLVRRLIALHQGTISVTSQPGQGSCFTIHLPYQIPQDFRHLPSEQAVPDGTQLPQISLPPLPQPASGTSPLILIAEDHDVNAFTITSYLEGRGYRCLWARNGQEAVHLATLHQPDLIVMDIQMPEMDGLEAMGRIRADFQLFQTPIIALTALAMESDRENCLAAGASDYIPKPVKLKQLLLKIQAMLQASKSSQN